MAKELFYLNVEDQAAYDSLKSRIDDLTEDEDKKFQSLRKKLQTLKLKRFENVEKVQKQIKDLGLTIRELYGDQLGSVLKEEGYGPHDLFSTSEISGKRPKAPSSFVRPSDSNPVVLETLKGKGVFKYRKGRVFEEAAKGKGAPWTDASFPVRLAEFGQDEATLLTLATEDGKAYFATEEGKKELEALVKEAIKMKPVVDARKTKSGASE